MIDVVDYDYDYDDDDDDDDEGDGDDGKGQIWSDISTRSRHCVCPAGSQQSDPQKHDDDDYEKIN